MKSPESGGRVELCLRDLGDARERSADEKQRGAIDASREAAREREERRKGCPIAVDAPNTPGACESTKVRGCSRLRTLQNRHNRSVLSPRSGKDAPKPRHASTYASPPSSPPCAGKASSTYSSRHSTAANYPSKLLHTPQTQSPWTSSPTRSRPSTLHKTRARQTRTPPAPPQANTPAPSSSRSEAGAGGPSKGRGPSSSPGNASF